MSESTARLVRVPPELPEVRILRLQPGDALMVNVPWRLTDAEFEELRQRMKAAFPDHRMGVLEGGMTLDVVRMEGD